MKKTVLKCVCLILFLIATDVFAQKESKLFEKSSNIYWLKSRLEVKDSITNLKTTMPESLLNFNSPIDFKTSDVLKKVSSLVNYKSSFFLVFRSSSEEEVDLFKFGIGTFKGYGTSKKIVSDNEELLDKVTPKSGAIISHIFSKNSLISRRKGTLEFSDIIYNDKGCVNNIYELVYLPDAVSKKEQNIIESYLSIKYGVSLIGEKNYSNSSGDTIWNFKKNGNYNFRISGIGRDDASKLYQKQSGNSVKDGLYIGLDKIAKSNIKNRGNLIDKSFLLWGDNNLKTIFKENILNGLSSIDRVWKTNKTDKDVLTTQLIINKKEMGLVHKAMPDDNIWLVIDSLSSEQLDYIHSKYIKATTENDSLVIFDNIKWISQSSLFTFVKAPDLLLNYAFTPAICSATVPNGKIEIGMQGGSAPYTINLYSDNYKRTFTSLETSFIVSDLANDEYIIEVLDKFGKTQKAEVTLDPFANLGIKLAQEWYLQNGEVIKIVPEILTNDIIKYKWTFGDKVVSTEKELVTSDTGEYRLLVTMASGCSKEIPFSVSNKSMHTLGNFSVYPNPCKANATFSIAIDQPELMDTSLLITDIHGKTIISKNFGKIQNVIYEDELSQAATYVIIVTSNGQQQIGKIIIN